MLLLADIKEMDIRGNGADDIGIMLSVDMFVQDTDNSVADRAEALRYMSDKVMGCGRDENMSDLEIVTDYIDNM